MPKTQTLRAEYTLTKAEAAARADVHERTIRRWLADGVLTRYVLFPNRTAIDSRELDKIIRSRTTATRVS